MNKFSRHYPVTLALVFAGILFTASCQQPANQTTNQTTPDSNANTNAIAETQPTPAASPSAAPQANDAQQALNLPVTLPVLDAMFADDSFTGDLKNKLNLSDEQIGKLRSTAREATQKLQENSEGSAGAARRAAEDQIRGIIGADKASALANLIRERWSNGTDAASGANNNRPNSIPTDTRIVVNAPAFRMDLFKDGQLLRSYKIGIGYPEFPLPTGMRKAGEIIFNPTWTPPDEPWVEGSNKVKVGQKVEAGSKLNPLGPIKIPIGLPSLIHGGKSPARLGEFASHGCVGLTNPQVQDFSLALAQLTGTGLTDEDVANYEKNKTETKNVKLASAIPVELRYETIVVENGTLKIYRDVYERGTNTEENLKRTLDAYGVSFDSLSEQERAKILDALKQMAVDAGGEPVDAQSANNNSNSGGANKNAGKNGGKNDNSQSAKVTRTIKGKKEIDIQIAALKGKGYPAPVDLNTGAKSGKPLNLSASNAANQTNTDNSAQPNNSTSRKF